MGFMSTMVKLYNISQISKYIMKKAYIPYNNQILIVYQIKVYIRIMTMYIKMTHVTYVYTLW